MEINKRCISAFARTEPFVALATKSKLFDPTFSLTSELILINYMTGKFYPPVITELKFCKIRWCEFNSISYLVAGHENGVISIYDRTEEGLVLLKSKPCMEGDITALDFLPSKSILVAGSSKGKIVFWTLSNLDKEYALDIPLSVGISAISWNPKVSKILCIGTSDGVVKVLDIKKSSVIMTLGSKDFSEIKQLEWDPENNTRLIVMSEKGYLNVFDLSNDSVARIGGHAEPLIGFGSGILVSRNLIENKGHAMKITESFDCSISKRDPVIALSYSSGSTQIMSIPFIRSSNPFFRHRKYIITQRSKYEIVVVNQCEASQNDQFYSTLIKMLHSNDVDMKAVGDFLLDNAENIDKRYLGEENTVAIDTNDPVTLSFLKGDISKLRECYTKIDLGLLESMFERDVSLLKEVTDFNILFVFSKLLGDYSLLSKVANPRILAAIMIYNDVKDFGILKGSREALVLRGLFTKNFGEYIDNRVVPEPNYLKKMKSIEACVQDIMDVASEPISSSYLTDLFWYKMFMDDLESLKGIRISDKNVEYFIKMNSSPSVLTDKMKDLGVKQDVGRTPPSPAQRPQDSKSSFRVYGSSHQSSSSTHHPSIQKSHATSKIAEAPQQAFPIASPFPRPSAALGFSSTARSSTTSTPFPGTSSHGVHVKSPRLGNIPQPPRPVASGISMSPSSTVVPQRLSRMPSPSASIRAPIPRPASHTPAPRPPVQMDGSSSGTHIGNPSDIVSNFETTANELRERSASKNSLILRQRKIQYLNALNSYNSIDKASIPSGLLHAMDLVTKRIKCADETMKTDLDTLVDGFGDVLWLRAFVELAKMVY